MKTVEQQILNSCIHFNGMMNKLCLKFIKYDDVRVKDSKPYKLPCLLNSQMSGGKCDSCEFPTKEQAKKEAEEMEIDSNKVMVALALVKSHYKKTNKPNGILECPECKGELQYSVATINGHTRGNCNGCDTNWIE